MKKFKFWCNSGWFNENDVINCDVKISLGGRFFYILDYLGIFNRGFGLIVLSEPTPIDCGYTYDVKLYSKNYYLFGFKIYTKIL